MRRAQFRLGRAFTLVEVLIVVVILGILAAIIVPSFSKASETSKVNATLTELAKLRRHLEVYHIRNSGAAPTVAEGDGTWGELVGPDHLLAPPTNSYIGGQAARTIIFRDTPDAAFPDASYGWIYSASKDEVWAAGFDVNDEPLPLPGN